MVELYDSNADKSLLMNSDAFDFDKVYFDNLDEVYKTYLAHISIDNYLRFIFLLWPKRRETVRLSEVIFKLF